MRPGSLVEGALLIGLLFCGAPSSSAQEQTNVRELVEILSDRELRIEQPGAVRKRLVDLGPERTDSVFELLAGRAPDLGPGANLDAGSRELLYAVMREWPSSQVASRLNNLVEPTSPLGERLAVLRILGEVGDSTAVPLVAEIVTSFDAKEARPEQVRMTVETTLRKILTRDPGAYKPLGDLISAAEDQHFPPVVDALGEGGSAAGLPLLERMIGRNDELDLRILDAVSKMDRWDPEADLDRGAWIVRTYLESSDPLFRRQAAVSLGRLGDGQAISALIEALDDDDRRVKRGALWGLREITSLGFEGERERWLAWYAEEKKWFDTRSGELAAIAVEEDRGRAIAALREIGYHRIFSSSLVEGVVPALRHESPEVAAYACGILAQLGHPKAFTFLVDALNDDRDAVRAAAARSLQVLTGENRPADAEEWERWAESGKSLSAHG